uniref:Uncharacterized protein n=1 Tax=Anguilla anguilla TaxID=7936 RepID=A0A0E9TXT8_ANGAN
MAKPYLCGWVEIEKKVSLSILCHSTD